MNDISAQQVKEWEILVAFRVNGTLYAHKMDSLAFADLDRLLERIKATLKNAHERAKG